MTYQRHREVLSRSAIRLARRYEGVFAAEPSERLLPEADDVLTATSRASTYLPLLAERFAHDRLRPNHRSHRARHP